jgi:hypothetical protein
MAWAGLHHPCSSLVKTRAIPRHWGFRRRWKSGYRDVVIRREADSIVLRRWARKFWEGTYYSSESFPFPPKVADFNRDSRPDLAAAVRTGVMVLFNIGP